MLSNVVGIVSGGASGLGAAASKNLLRHGARVIVADLEKQKENFMTMIQEEGVDISKVAQMGDCSSTDPCISFVPTDVTKPEEVSEALDVAENVFGAPVNAVISCAGICPARKTLSRGKGSSSKFLPHPVDVLEKTLNVNVVGSFNMASLAAERMLSRDPGEPDGLRGCIINTASIAAFDGQRGQVAYAASKAAVVGMTLPMARDLAEHGIRVMTIVSMLEGRRNASF